MKIEKINVNNYGNLSNKEIELEDKINVIYGKNEAGKSTLLSFIESMFFGANKNKNNKSIPDYDRFEPWNNGEYSGNIKYVLENGEEYSVYRDFRKKNPQILDKIGKDVTLNFDIDKRLGNMYFKEQTGMSRELMDSTIITEQKQVELDQGTQNQLLQKIANLSESGEEELSYKKVKDRLNKILLNEIGTERSQQKPINIVKDNINTYENAISEIKQYDDERFSIGEEIAKVQEKINEENAKKELYNEIKKVIDNDKFEQEKIDLKVKTARENDDKIKKLEEELKEDETNSKNKRKRAKIVEICISIVLIIAGLATFYFSKNAIALIPFIALIVICLGLMEAKSRKKESKDLENKIEFLKNTNTSIKNEIEEMQKALYNKDEQEKIRILQKCENDKIFKNFVENKEDIIVLFSSKIEDTISENLREIEQNEINKHKLEIDEKEIEKEYANLAEYEEKLEIEKGNLEELEHKQKIVNIAMDTLEKSYSDMKENVTPEFNKNLSKNIEVFSNGKYKDVIINDKIFVKLENGEQIPIEKLSTGTIEQIYLAFRLGVIEEISKEKMPIILDEAFAFYDDERLLETLKFLEKIDNQIIILTCTKREKDLLDRAKISYNSVEL